MERSAEGVVLQNDTDIDMLSLGGHDLWLAILAAVVVVIFGFRWIFYKFIEAVIVTICNDGTVEQQQQQE